MPEQVCLSEYGLGTDARAREPHAVASHFGPRLFDWQVSEDVSRSWHECEAHAEIVKRLVPTESLLQTGQDDHSPAGVIGEPEVGYQSGLF